GKPRTRRPSGSACNSRMLYSMAPSVVGSKYVKCLPSHPARPYVGPRQFSTSPDANQTIPSDVAATPRMFTGSPSRGGRNTGGHSNEGTKGLIGSQLCTQSESCSLNFSAPPLVRPPIQMRPSGPRVRPNQSPNVMILSGVHGPPMQATGWTWSAYHWRSSQVLNGSMSRCGGG